jgi:hypothetical protein
VGEAFGRKIAQFSARILLFVSSVIGRKFVWLISVFLKIKTLSVEKANRPDGSSTIYAVSAPFFAIAKTDVSTQNHQT